MQSCMSCLLDVLVLQAMAAGPLCGRRISRPVGLRRDGVMALTFGRCASTTLSRTGRKSCRMETGESAFGIASRIAPAVFLALACSPAPSGGIRATSAAGRKIALPEAASAPAAENRSAREPGAAPGYCRHCPAASRRCRVRAAENRPALSSTRPAAMKGIDNEIRVCRHAHALRRRLDQYLPPLLPEGGCETGTPAT